MSRKAWIVAACLFLFPALTQAIDHPTSKPYETRPSPDGFLPYQILPIPDGLKIEKDVMIPMPDGVKLACNVVRPDKTGKFAVVLAVTPYGKDHTPPIYNKDGSPLPGAYPPFILRVHAHGEDIGHMKVSPLPPGKPLIRYSGLPTTTRSSSWTRGAASNPRERTGTLSRTRRTSTT